VRQVSEALAEPVAEAQQFVQQQRAQYVDETGWPEGEQQKLWESLWTFVRVEGVEPTNNNAERPLRRAVIWRRKSFGTQSESGSRFVERILTVVTTLRQQGLDVLEYLTTVCAVASVSASSPCLLPDSS
jgi:transposase